MPRLVIVLGLLVASAMSRLTPSLAAGLGTLLLVTITFRYWDLLFDPERWVDVLRMKGPSSKETRPGHGKAKTAWSGIFSPPDTKLISDRASKAPYQPGGR